MRKLFLYVLPTSVFVLPLIASAHEVYVLDAATIARDIASVSPDPLSAFYTNKYQFFLWGFIFFIGFSTIFFMSIFHRFEEAFSPFFTRMKKYAAPVARMTLGVCLIASAYNGALFGPELPFASFGSAAVTIIPIIFYISGTLITLGLYTRFAALLLLPVLLLSLIERGTYMPTYANYFGEIFFVIAVGGGLYSLGGNSVRWMPDSLRTYFHMAERYSWPTLRIGLGISILFAAIFAKFVHSNLALDTIAQYNLDNFFPFDPLFTVLGAFIIESLIGIFFIIGLEIRWNAIFFLFWIFLSLLYFGEAVWPHLVLIGLNIAFILHGYDKYSIEGYFFKKRLIEPVL
ncbi:MAG: hypothetical protein Q8R25_00030 [bacterium]|nr:hypothetical protein [bacterium]